MNARLRSLPLAVALVILAGSTPADELTLTWFGVNAGAQYGAGADLELRCTIGQADAGAMAGGDLQLVGGFWNLTTAPRLGDLNCDCAFDGADIDAFFLALGDPALYRQQHPGCDIMNGDINQDGAVDGADIDAFFALLTG